MSEQERKHEALPQEGEPEAPRRERGGAGSVMQDFVLPTGVLTAICLVVSGALSYTYGLTQPVIEANKLREANKSIVEVLPAAEEFTDKTDGLPEGVSKVHMATNGAGAVAELSVKGYGGPVSMMVGIGADGTITGVKVLDHTETQGLGSRVMDPEYTAGFVGKSSPDEVDNISGATVSSTALKKGISLAKEACGAAQGGAQS